MTSRERYLTALSRATPPDRVPLMLEAFHVPGEEAIDGNPDPLWREVARRAFEHVPAIRAVHPGINRYLVTPPQRLRHVARTTVGSRVTVTSAIDTPKGTLTAITRTDAGLRTTWQIKYPVETIRDLEALAAVPWELPPNLVDREPLAADERTIRRLHISSPVVCVAGAMPYELFLELCATEPELIEHLTHLCLERCLDVLEMALLPGDIDVVWIGGCEWVTPPMASAAVYERFVQEPERRLIERIHAAGAYAHVHCHGNVRETLERVIDRGADYFEPVEPPPDGDIRFAEAKAVAGGRIVLGGNLEVRVLERGTPEEVEAAVAAAFEGGRRHMALADSAGPVGAFDERTRDNYLLVIELWERESPLS